VELIRLARSRWRVEQDYRELKGGLGLDHFEGRGWPGWQHHVTLVLVAHGFSPWSGCATQNRALPLLPWVMRAVSVVAGTGRRR
jgi:SRSO17 transposase